MVIDKGTWEHCLQFALVTDTGLRRENNQDAMKRVLAPNLDEWRQHGHLLMVADGMGAHAAGELASKLAVDGVSHLFHKYRYLAGAEVLERAVRETNTEIYRRGQANIDFNNMGTTASILLMSVQGALVAHVGDSRVYRLRGSTLEQLTRDHSLVWEMRDAGHLGANEQLINSIPKNVITRSLGPYPEVDTDIEGPIGVLKDDVFLLCTDGLTGRVSDTELAAVLAYFEPDKAAQVFVDLANLRGGPDNITAIIARVLGDAMSSGQPVPAAREVVHEPRAREGLPIPWLMASVLGLAAIILLIVDQRWPAGLVLGASVASALWGLFWRGGARRVEKPRPEGARVSKAPYVTVRCPSERDAQRMFGDTLKQIRQSARVGGWEEDVESLEEMVAQAESLAHRGDHRAALQTQARTLRELAERLRIYRARHDADSLLDF